MQNKRPFFDLVRFVLSGLCVENINLGNVLFSNQNGEIVYDKRPDYWNDDAIAIDLGRNIKIVEASLSLN